jgi:DNA-binding transcriptional regulator YdaS (Cro superfamily)
VIFLATSLSLLATVGGCSSIAQAIDCDQMCEELRTCVDGDLDVQHCADRCEDKTDTNTLRHQLDDCTDCLDHGYSCGEIEEQCPACQGVTDALL